MFFLFIIWYIENSGICQNKAKANKTYINNETEIKCLNTKKW